MTEEAYPMPRSIDSSRIRIYGVVAVLLVLGIFSGYLLGAYSGQTQLATLNSRLSDLQEDISILEAQVVSLQSTGGSSTAYNATSLNSLYESVKDSIVTVQGVVAEYGFFGRISYTEVLGSGFVVNLTGEPLIVTNNHVVDGMINGSVTFINGDSYPFTVLGTDEYSDLAILRVEAPAELLVPLTVVSSKTVSVGDTVIAIGNPYGLQSTLTAGIVSQVDRAISTSTTTSYELADMIQISTPINPGNSGGPLLDAGGRVVGITAAIIDDSNDVGFAVPSDAILKEIQDLVTEGSYSHSYIGLSGLSLDYLVSTAAGLNTTHGILVQSVAAGSPASAAGLRGGTQTIYVAGSSVVIGGDVILEVDGQAVRSMDDLLSYLEESTVPGQALALSVLRGGEVVSVTVTLGSRG